MKILLYIIMIFLMNILREGDFPNEFRQFIFFFSTDSTFACLKSTTPGFFAFLHLSFRNMYNGFSIARYDFNGFTLNLLRILK